MLRESERTPIEISTSKKKMTRTREEKKKNTTWKIITQTHMVSYSLRNIFRLLWINKFKVSFRYIPRLLWVFWMSTITLPLRIIEKIRFQKKIKNTKLTKDPIFIIGFYRTATTLLHILFSKDKRLGYMSNLDVFTPLYNLSFSDPARRILKRRLPKTRPMDNIELDIDGPQEESYAVATLSKYGVPNVLIFPQNYKYFAKYMTFEHCPPKDVMNWKKIYHYFIQKTTVKNEGKQLVLKNPANAARIKLLLEMYPNAKFIYTYRNPYPLLCSLKLLFHKLMELSALQVWNEEKFNSFIINELKHCFSVFEKTKELIPPKNFYSLKYEDFISDPLPFLEEIYDQFELDDFQEIKKVIQEYIDVKKEYKANIHEITPEVIQTVNINLEQYRIYHGYEQLSTDDS